MKRIRTSILLLSMLTLITTDTVAPLIKQMGASYPTISSTMIKQTITLPSLMTIFFALLSGQLVKVLSKKAVLIIGLVLYSIGGLAAGWSATFAWHLFFRAMIGAGGGLISPIVTSLTADHYEGKERADLVGFSFSLSHFMAVIYPPMAAFFGAENWRNAFWLFLIAPVIMGLTIILLPLKDAGKVETQKNEGKAQIPSQVIGLAAIALLLVSVFFIIVTDMTFFLDERPNTSDFSYAFGLSISTLGSTVAGLTFSMVFSRLKRWSIPTGLLTCGLGFILAIYARSESLLLLGLFATGYGLGLLIAIIMLATTDAVKEGDSTAAVSVVNGAFSIGIYLSPFLFSFLQQLPHDKSDMTFNFELAGIFYLVLGVCSIFYLFLRNQKVKATVQP